MTTTQWRRIGNIALGSPVKYFKYFFRRVNQSWNFFSFAFFSWFLLCYFGYPLIPLLPRSASFLCCINPTWRPCWRGLSKVSLKQRCFLPILYRRWALFYSLKLHKRLNLSLVRFIVASIVKEMVFGSKKVQNSQPQVS